MKNQSDPRQTELWRDYRVEADTVKAALARLHKVVLALMESGVPAPVMDQKVKELKAETDQCLKEVRGKINKIVKVHAYSKHLTFQEIWRIVLARLRDETGFDAVVAKIANGKGNYLDAIERRGMLTKTLKIAAAL